MRKPSRTGIDLLRYAVRLFDNCNETFNQQHSARDLLSIAEANQESKWDISPDRWEKQQVQNAVQDGEAPDWDEVDGEVVAVYKTHNNSGENQNG